jgi:predicted ATPase/DNA-binding SARP family transcriptional activator
VVEDRRTPSLEFRILGPIEVWKAGHRLPLAGAKQRRLLAILLLNANKVVSTDTLIELLWGADSDNAAGALHVHVSALRKLLEPERSPGDEPQVLITRVPGYMIKVSNDQLDLAHFERLVQEGRHALTEDDAARASSLLRAALSLWRGPPLSDVSLDPFRHHELDRMEEARISALEDRFEADLALGHHAHLVAEIEAVAADHPLRERLRGQLMLALYRSGRQAEALEVYRDTSRMLSEELGIDPSNTLQHLNEDILHQDASLEWFPSEAPRTNLPVQLTSFIGRTREMDQVRRFLKDGRLVTLVGPGGGGKTRLAIQVATELMIDYADGVWLVELADLTEGELLPQTLLATLGLSEQPGRPALDPIETHLKERSALLVLDNCEHLIDACARTADRLLHSCPRLRILATSREALGVYGEIAWSVPPLSIPPKGSSMSPEEVAHYEAVRLFVDRAAAVTPEFKLTDANVSFVVQICRRLDGIPLAIELAAARTRSLPINHIADRLDDVFLLLTKGSRMGVARHRTLRATLDWSYQLLIEPERRLLARLSVFAGGFSIHAAEQICTYDDIGVDEVLDLVSQLIEKSLLALDESAGRYRLPETVRQYGRDKLSEFDETEKARRRHADLYLEFADKLEQELQGSQLSDALSQLDAEHDNLRAALSFYVESANGEAELRLAGALSRYWYLRGHYREGREWLESALKKSAAAPKIVVAKALSGAGSLAHLECDYARAATLCRRGLDLYRELSDKRGIASTLTSLGAIAREQSDYERALDLHREALDVFRDAGDRWGVAHSLQMSGFAAWLSSDYERAKQLSGESLTLFRELNDKERIAWALLDLGAVAHYQANPDRAARLLQESLSLFTEVQFKEGIAWSLNLLGLVEKEKRNRDRARELLEKSLSLHRALGDRWRVSSVLEALAGVESDSGDSDRAVHLLSEAASLRNEIGAPIPRCERPDYDRTKWASLREAPTHVSGEPR